MIGVIGRLGSHGLEEALAGVHSVAGDRAIFSSNLAHCAPRGVRLMDPERMSADVSVFLSLGGDGTLLEAARYAMGKPVAGVNLGFLGFLAFYHLAELEHLTTALLGGNYTSEERACLEVVKGGERDIALNDITLVATMARMLTIEVWRDGNFVLRYRGDGLIISTPTGSTAYNLAAGGPILYPSLEAMVLTAICAHSLTVRPIVLPSDTVLEIKAESRGEKMLLSADGRESFLLESSDGFSVRMSEQKARFVRTPWAPDFFSVLRKKLEWG
ncbi:MAG: NAD(+)/NADH kinase [candidate division WOR-3 bacterium]